MKGWTAALAFVLPFLGNCAEPEKPPKPPHNEQTKEQPKASAKITAKLLVTLPTRHSTQVVAFSPDGKFLAGEDSYENEFTFGGALYLWNVKDWTPYAKLEYDGRGDVERGVAAVGDGCALPPTGGISSQPVDLKGLLKIRLCMIDPMKR